MNAALITINLPNTRKSGSPLSPSDISVITILRSDNGAAAAVVATVTTPTSPQVVYTDKTVVAGVQYGYSTFAATVADGPGATSDVFPFSLGAAAQDPPAAPTIISVVPTTV